MKSDVYLKHVVGLKSGSHEDFNRLYLIHANMLYGFVLSLTKSPTNAKDVLQETFLRVWQTKENISLNMSFKAYLYTIAHNLIIDSFRNKINNVAFESYIASDAYQLNSENSTEEKINFDEFLEILRLAKEKLTHKQKIIFELSIEKGYPNIKIAELLKISEKTVKNQRSLAIKMIKNELLQSDLTYLIVLYLFLLGE